MFWKKKKPSALYLAEKVQRSIEIFQRQIGENTKNCPEQYTVMAVCYFCMHLQSLGVRIDVSESELTKFYMASLYEISHAFPNFDEGKLIEFMNSSATLLVKHEGDLVAIKEYFKDTTLNEEDLDIHIKVLGTGCIGVIQGLSQDKYL
jgi:hypothetical protein